MRTQQEKVVTIQGTDYLIKKFTPEVGCYWATRLTGDIVSLMGTSTGSIQSRLPQMIKDFTRMERKDFVLFQRDCLSFVAVKFGNEFHALINSDGFFTQPDLSGPVAFQLTLHSFMFTIVDFLDQSLLDDLLGALPGEGSPTTKTGSENSSLPPSDSNTGSTTTCGTENTPLQTSLPFST